MVLSSRLLTGQWFTGMVLALAGAGAVPLSWALNSTPLSQGDALRDGMVAVALVGGVILAHRYPILAPGLSRLNMAPVPLFLMAALLPIPLAVSAIGLGTLVGEAMARRGSGVPFLPVATEAGRWVLIGLVASLVAHSTAASGSLQLLFLLGSAAVFWLGDAVTSSLTSAATRCQSPLRVVAVAARESGLANGGLYLIGVLGALAATRSAVTVVLIFFPAVLAYRAIKRAMELETHARQMLAMVANVSSDAVLLLDAHGRIVSGNRHAAALYACQDAQATVGRSLTELIMPQDRHRIEQDLRRAVLGNKVKAAEYALHSAGGAAFAVDMECSSASDTQSGSGVVLCVLQDLTEQKRVEKVHTHRALNDSLTGLPGRALLFDRLEQCLARARREGSPFAVCLLDLNQLEQINDRFGHRVGDLVLQQVGRRVRRVLRDSDTVARLGGDDFAVVLPSADEQGASLVAGRLMRALNEPYSIDDRALEVTPSMGIALYPDHGSDGEGLMQRAEAAVRIAKLSGSGYSFFEPNHNSKLSNDSVSVERRRGLEPADQL